MSRPCVIHDAVRVKPLRRHVKLRQRVPDKRMVVRRRIDNLASALMRHPPVFQPEERCVGPARDELRLPIGQKHWVVRPGDVALKTLAQGARHCPLQDLELRDPEPVRLLVRDFAEVRGLEIKAAADHRLAGMFGADHDRAVNLDRLVQEVDAVRKRHHGIRLNRRREVIARFDPCPRTQPKHRATGGTKQSAGNHHEILHRSPVHSARFLRQTSL